MTRLTGIALFAASSLLWSTVALADGGDPPVTEPNPVVFASADPGPTTFIAPGSLGNIGDGAFRGQLIRILRPTEVTGFGAQLVQPNPTKSIFAALVKADDYFHSPDSSCASPVPTWDPTVAPGGDASILASALVQPGLGSGDVEVTLASSVILEPGDYALIFGSGFQGATGPQFVLGSDADHAVLYDDNPIGGHNHEPIYFDADGDATWRCDGWTDGQGQPRADGYRVLLRGLEVWRPAQDEIERIAADLDLGIIGGLPVSVEPGDGDMTNGRATVNAGRLAVTGRQLDSTLLLLEMGDHSGGCGWLNRVLKRTDGDLAIEDWFEGDVSVLLATEILDVMAALACP